MLRQKFRHLLLASFMILIAATASAHRFSQEQRSTNSREIQVIEAALPKDVYEIVNINNAQAADFPVKFQVEVKNISARPIYYLEIHVLLPKSSGSYPSPVGLPLRFGNPKPINFDVQAGADDPAIQPGESKLLEVEARNAEDTLKDLHRKEIYDLATRKVVLIPQTINFGDGTGYCNATRYGVK